MSLDDLAELRRDPESLLAQLNDALAGLEARLISGLEGPQWPVCFVVGAPRSGHTLVSQLLARSGALGFVDNFVARFWRAPCVGLALRRALVGEVDELRAGVPESRWGRTPGLGDVHEFGYFLRRWIPEGPTDRAEPQRIAPEAAAEWRREVAGLERLWDRPMFFKNAIYGLNLGIVRAAFPRALIVVVRRRALYQAQSIALARDAHGGRSRWWSLRTPDFPELASQAWYDQIAGQIAGTYACIREESPEFGPGQTLEISYEVLCGNPTATVRAILERLAALGAPSTDLPQPFRVRLTDRNRAKLSPREIELLRHALRRRLAGEPIE